MVFPFGRICNSVNTVSLFTQTSEVCGGEQVGTVWGEILSFIKEEYFDSYVK